MATASVSKTFKLDPETVESLQQIMQTSGLSWDGVFSMLANLYAAQEAAKSVGRETELQDFVTILNKAQEAYTSALAINANTDERIRAEYERRLRTAEEATASLKDKALAAEEKAKAMEQERNDVQEKLKAATKEAEQAAKRAEKAEKVTRQSLLACFTKSCRDLKDKSKNSAPWPKPEKMPMNSGDVLILPKPKQKICKNNWRRPKSSTRRSCSKNQAGIRSAWTSQGRDWRMTRT